MDDATRKAWESGPYGKCLALAREDREQKRAGRLHWSAANFIDDDTTDAYRVRPTEAQAVSRAFWSCEDAHAVLRDIRAGNLPDEMAHFPPTLQAEWLANIEAYRQTRIAQMRAQFREVWVKSRPLFDMAGIETKEESA